MDSNFRRNLPPKAYAVKRDKPRLHPQVEATLSNKRTPPPIQTNNSSESRLMTPPLTPTTSTAKTPSIRATGWADSLMAKETPSTLMAHSTTAISNRERPKTDTLSSSSPMAPSIRAKSISPN